MHHRTLNPAFPRSPSERAPRHPHRKWLSSCVLVGALLTTSGCEREWAALFQTIEDIQEFTGTPAQDATPGAASDDADKARDDRRDEPRHDQREDSAPTKDRQRRADKADAEADAVDNRLTASLGVPCERTGYGSPRMGIAPNPKEFGHYAAASFPLGLAPLDEPFVIDEVVYYLLDDPSRLPLLGLVEHEVELFISPRISPPRQPKVLWKSRVTRKMFGKRPAFLVPEGPFYEVRVPVTPPLTVRGQGHVFVSVQINQEQGSGKTIGLGVCTTVPAERSWWSGASRPPFRWKALQDHGIQGALIAHLNGRRAQ